jgi:hypothetical protein
MKPGTYTMSVSLDVTSQLGKIESKRFVVISNTVRPAGVTDAAIRTGIKPGVKRRLLPLKAPFDPEGNLSAVATWTPTKDALVFRADVTDACFSTSTPPASAQEASCIEIGISPNGSNTTGLVVVPDGPADKARLAVGNSTGAKAYWKRTPKGYIINLAIPWKSLTGYDTSWEAMLVQAQVNTKAPKGRACVNTSKGGRMSKPETYAVLRSK